jgi:hypothetical protein
LVIVIGGTNSIPIVDAQDSQSQSTTCNDDSCYTIICSENSPCQSFTSNGHSVAQPVGESNSIEPIEAETTIMQPSEKVQFKKERSQSVIDPVTVEENRHDGDGKNQDEQYGGDDDGGQMDNPAQERFEQELHGTPEELEVETGFMGMGISVDYIVISDDEQDRVIENPNRKYNGGLFSLQRGGTVSFSFAYCHTECVGPEEISSVYLVEGDANDEDIINNAVDDSVKAKFEQIDQGSFQFKVPNGITGSNTLNKLVINMEQADGISAFYIHEGVEVS